MNKILSIICLMLVLLLPSNRTGYSQQQAQPLVLQEMTWTDVQAYLEHNDMVIIPMGSTEQHGPHLPLGTDCFEAFDIAREISSKTGVVVAQILWVGYSAYHSGFPGTLSIRPQTMEQVLFEATEYLIKYGFRRIMFFNYHGGNDIVQRNVIHRINQETQAIAVAIGIGSSLQSQAEKDSLDYHAGVRETSAMLFLRPDLVRKERIEKPVMHFTPLMEELMKQSEEYPKLSTTWNNLLGAPVETGKGGASHELTNNGIWTLRDPKTATADEGKIMIQRLVERAVTFIKAWENVNTR